MDKRIGHTDKCDQKNWSYTSPNTIIIIPPIFYNSIKNQHNSDYNASVGENDLRSARLDKNNNYHVHTDVNDNADSQSHNPPWKNNFHCSSSGDTIITKTTPQLSTLPPPVKEYPCFQIEGKSSHASQCAK